MYRVYIPKEIPMEIEPTDRPLHSCDWEPFAGCTDTPRAVPIALHRSFERRHAFIVGRCYEIAPPKDRLILHGLRKHFHAFSCRAIRLTGCRANDAAPENGHIKPRSALFSAANGNDIAFALRYRAHLPFESCLGIFERNELCRLVSRVVNIHDIRFI